MAEKKEIKPTNQSIKDKKRKGQFMFKDLTEAPTDRKLLPGGLSESVTIQPFLEEKSYPPLRHFLFGNVSRYRAGGNKCGTFQGFS